MTLRTSRQRLGLDLLIHCRSMVGVCRNDFFEPDPDITEENPVVPDPVPDV